MDDGYDPEDEDHGDIAEAHKDTLDEAADLARKLNTWQPTAHIRYQEQATFEGFSRPPVKMDVRAKARALKAYGETGRKGLAAAAAGCSRQCLDQHLKDDPEFADAWADAKDDFSTRLQLGLYQRGFVGTPKPIVGRVGKDQDGIIGYELVRSDSVALAMAKAFMPELYGDRLQVDANVTGGVLVVGAPMTADAWMLQNQGVQPKNHVPLLEEIRTELTRDGTSLK